MEVQGLGGVLIVVGFYLGSRGLIVAGFLMVVGPMIMG
jgi:hypothetical protein